jgi:DNA polymerase elongation subunit (family B)
MHFYTNVYQHRNLILVREFKDGEYIQKQVQYKPTFYVPTNKDSSFRSVKGQNLEPKKFNSIAQARQFREKWKDVEGFDVHGIERHPYAYIAEYFPQDIEWMMRHVRVMNLDIECECENGFPEPTEAAEEINAISFKMFGKDTKYVFGTQAWEHNDPTIKYFHCQNEKQLLKTFLEEYKKIYPDIITGWNVDQFDITYLYNRISKLFSTTIADQLSPWNITTVREWDTFGKKQQAYTLTGVEVVDYLQLYQKFTFKRRDSYKLENISQIELGKGKINYEEFGAMHLFYKKDYQKFLEYNVRDVTLVEELDDKLGLMGLLIQMAYTAKCNYLDAFRQVRYWDILIFNRLKQQNIIVPPARGGAPKKQKFMGAYVKDPQVGMHEWVMSFDLNSLYPHLIMQYNISPETFSGMTSDTSNVDMMLNKEVRTNTLFAQTPNGAKFSKRKQGFLPEILENLYDERVLWKNKMIEHQKEFESTDDPRRKQDLNREIAIAYNNQMVRKISLNSAYGAIGNEWFRYFEIGLAEAVTSSGQLAIKWVEHAVNKYLNTILGTEDDYVVAIDTDSIYVRFDELVKSVQPKNPIEFLDQVGNGKMQEVINKCYEELAEYTSAYQNKMVMGREVIADKGIWTAKKRYILNVYDNEGVRLTKPKLKMMGIETAKSSTPQWVRERLEDALKVVMKGDEKLVHEFVDNARKEFKELDPYDIAFPRRVNNLIEYENAVSIYKKGTPMHVRASLMFNHLIVQKGLDMQFEPIQSGENIRFLYLKVPNPIKENVVGFINTLPREFNLHSYIDYDLQFDKSFIEPLKLILEKIGWSTEPQSSLEDFFN